MNPSIQAPAPCLCQNQAAQGPAWRRWWQALRRRVAVRRPPEPTQPSTWREQDLLSLRGLSTRTLRDIGAPDWVHEGRDDRVRVALDQLRL